ncbi:alpha-xenorhabdolysin family binary toxin subunit A [Pseudomonas sp. NPDC078416]|uniref:alpha-xenorhabdolysin family binary toxin subunit A n=1 Tax=Pseudomonas sp. NPDC078416 TaxID=3390637 RepID=UPI003D061221
MSYALSDTPDASVEAIVIKAANAPKTLMDASTGNITGSIRPKGLILTKEQIIDLYRYEQKGLQLPTSDADVSAYLGYDQSNPPGRGLEVKDFIKTFSIIKTHASQWAGLRQRIRSISDELKIFASSIMNTGKHVTNTLDTIASLKILKEYGIKTLEDLKRIEAELGDKFPGVELDEDDEEALSTLAGFLSSLLEKVEARERQTDALQQDLDNFAKALATEVRAEIKFRLEAIDNNTFKEDVILLQTEIEALNEEIDEKNASYKQTVKDSLTSATQLNVIGLGMAIYTGIEAEKIRKARNELKASRDKKNAEMGTKSTVLKRLNQVKADMQDLEFLSLQADAATENLVTVWNSLHLFVKTSKEQSEAITDALQVSALAYHLDEVIGPWTHILGQADELHEVFIEAENEIKNLNIHA